MNRIFVLKCDVYFTAILALATIFLGLFFWYGPSDLRYTITEDHAIVGFSLYKSNSLWADSALVKFVRRQDRQELRVSMHDASVVQPEGQLVPFPVNDTIGYGVLLGLLWKITGSLSVLDAQLLQMLLYLLSLFFVYQIALMLFYDRTIVLLSLLAHVFFLPLTALVVQPVRDVWAYYATVVLLWGVLRYLQLHASWPTLMIAGSFFALFQWIRPTAFLSLLTVIMCTMLLALIHKYRWQRVLVCAAWFVATNIVIFWIPFVTYNVVTYHRLMVGPVGQDLIEGLGEFENPWDFRLSDEFVATYIGTKYGLQMGTPEFDDRALDEFKKVYAQQPWLYWKNMIKRLPQFLLPGLPWLFPKISPYEGLMGWQKKLRAALSSLPTFFDFLLRHVLIRIFLLLGYLGMIIAWRRGDYVAVLLALAIMLGGLGKLPSHIECRYLVPFYWPVALFIAQLFYIKQFNFKA